MPIFGNKKSSNAESPSEREQALEGILAALDASQAIIEFEPDGSIITANSIFLSTTGYSLDEIQGRHHQIFVTAEELGSPE